jgi:3-hydroxyacyl-CoA dehydrogenase
MEITIIEENLVEKLFAQIMKNVEAQLKAQDLTEEEVQANLVLAKKSANNDAVAVSNLIIAALSE